MLLFAISTGGINLVVEGLLTFQVVDVAKLITQLGEQDLQRAITSVPSLLLLAAVLYFSLAVVESQRHDQG